VQLKTVDFVCTEARISAPNAAELFTRSAKENENTGSNLIQVHSVTMKIYINNT